MCVQVCFEQFRQSDRLKQNGFQKAVTQPGIPLSYPEAHVCVYCCRFAVQIYVKNNIFSAVCCSLLKYQNPVTYLLQDWRDFQFFFWYIQKYVLKLFLVEKHKKCEKQANGSTDYLQLVCLHLVWQ